MDDLCSFCKSKPKFKGSQTCSKTCRASLVGDPIKCVVCNNAPASPAVKWCSEPCKTSYSLFECVWCKLRPKHSSSGSATCSRTCQAALNSNTVNCVNCARLKITAPYPGTFGKFCSLQCHEDYRLLGPLLSADLISTLCAEGNLAALTFYLPQFTGGLSKPFCLAVKNGLLEVAKLLVKQGADPNTLDLTDEGPPLCFAVANADHHLIQFLLHNKADVNALSRPHWIRGKTPLHVACEKDNLPLVQLLQTHKADPCLRDARGRTPWDLASADLKTKVPSLPQSTPANFTSAVPSALSCHPDGLAQFLFPNHIPGNCELDSGSREFIALQRLMNTTILSGKKNQGYVRWPYQTFEIGSIRRHHDAARWDRCQQEPLAQTPLKWRYLFHGTSKKVIPKIIQHQFRQSTEGDFGEGVYMSENSSLAHVFATNKVACPVCRELLTMNFQTEANVDCTACGAANIEKNAYFQCTPCHRTMCRTCADRQVNDGEGWCYMLVCLVNLGKFKPNQKPCDPSHAAKGRDSAFPPGSWAPNYANTVTGHNTKHGLAQGFYEYLVVNVNRIYPCYAIKYKTNVAVQNG
eukprot:NODE_835_length_1822_cov_87.930973_g781_i0.p1 GENE.NODE_835_length_1822_cov_87.930973_g781_i0~~NODE_835_length_1822_cov_87.930973_g781_i0.p1  ORF type:complete len:593 (-),score=122.09 NODE_835_length_1822_cov_87.930973_g781_i0:44-1777(-)